MLRLHPKLIKKLLSVHSRKNEIRFLSSSKSSGKGKFSLLLGGSVFVFSGLTLAYAKYDKAFGDQLISYAPFVKPLLEDGAQSNTGSLEEFGTTKKKAIINEKPIVPIKSVVANLNSASASNVKTEPAKKTSSPATSKSTDKSDSASIDKIKVDVEDLIKKKEEELKKKVEESLEQKLGDRRQLEDEFRGQLKRLLHALNELYEEKRIMFETESKRRQEIELKDYLVQERAAITDEYEKSFIKLKQMEKLLQIREQLDKQEKASKKLWLLSQTLSKILEHNRNLSKEIQPININDKIECIKQVVKEHFANEALIHVALNSLSEDAIKNGVYSEEDLVRRFEKVHKIGNEVALVPDEYTNIFGYIKSYAYSCIRPLMDIDFELSVNPIKVREIPQEELEGKIEVDPKEWDAYDILQRVKICMEHRNLEMALRYANLLSGEPRRVARDWIKDTREHLEVKQALELVQSKIASMNLHQLSFTG